jgi:hypothetical protein
MASSPAPQFQAEIGHLRGLILEMGGSPGLSAV